MEIDTIKKHLKKLKDSNKLEVIANNIWVRFKNPERFNGPSTICPLNALCQERGRFDLFNSNFHEFMNVLDLEKSTLNIIVEAADFRVSSLSDTDNNSGWEDPKKSISLRKWLFKTFELNESYL